MHDRSVGILALLLLAAACKAPDLTAHQLESVRRRIHTRLVVLPTTLQLSKEQAQASLSLLKATRQDILRLVILGRRGDTKLRSASRLRRDFRAIRKDTEAQLEPVLSTAQMRVLRDAYDDVDTILRDANK